MPDYYSRLNPQPVEVIEAWELGFHLGNVIKYIARAPAKESELKDLLKAKWYLNRHIELRMARIYDVAPPPPEPQV